MTSSEIYGAEVPIPNALARCEQNRRQIVVFDGMTRLIRFYGAMRTACSILQNARPSVCYDLDGETSSEADLLMMCGHSIIADFVGGNCHPPIGFETMLGSNARLNVTLGTEAALLFILAHEAGHIALGHVDDSYPVSERPPDSLAYPELFDAFKEAELQADAFALDGMLGRFGEDVISSVMFFMSPFAFIESFAPARSGEHPLTVNRLRSLASRLSAGGRASSVTLEIVESQAASIDALLEQRRVAGGDIRSRIESSLPVRNAYAIMSHVEARILAEHGMLEVETVASLS